MSIHISAEKKQISNIVVMPGDPNRAKKMAHKYLENIECVNEVRGMLMYTGYIRGIRVTVAGSGMGIPSMGIYSYELFNEYDVDCIIRVGSMGSNNPNLKLQDIFCPTKAVTTSTFSQNLYDEEVYVSYPDKEITNILESCGNLKLGSRFKSGTIGTSLCFDKYIKDKDGYYEKLAQLNDDKNDEIYGCEMECFALFETAKYLGKKAACLLTVVDSNYDTKCLTSEERESDLDAMFDIVFSSMEVIKERIEK